MKDYGTPTVLPVRIAHLFTSVWFALSEIIVTSFDVSWVLYGTDCIVVEISSVHQSALGGAGEKGVGRGGGGGGGAGKTEITMFVLGLIEHTAERNKT